MIIDFQFGSTGKGLLAGYLAKRENYDTAVCSFATNAGHTYIDKARGLNVMTQQLPTGITSDTVRNILIGPGALIHVDTLLKEIIAFRHLLKNKRIQIHPHAAIVTDAHAGQEQSGGMSKIGSTTKGVGAAMIQRILRDPDNQNIAAKSPELVDLGLVTTAEEYRATLQLSENILIEGAQGFSLSMYHGFYPYTTSRDVTPWQIAADCGLPFKWASYIKVCATMRTFPIRVNNRDGTSGPGYPDQQELSWTEIGRAAELTTVTKLPRRVFEFSDEQTMQALWHCGGYWDTRIFLNFANYLKSNEDVAGLIKRIEAPNHMNLNSAQVAWIGFGPDDEDVATREEFAASGINL